MINPKPVSPAITFVQGPSLEPLWPAPFPCAHCDECSEPALGVYPQEHQPLPQRPVDLTDECRVAPLDPKPADVLNDPDCVSQYWRQRSHKL